VSVPLPLRCPRAETPHQPATAIVPHLLKLISNEEEIWGAGEDLEGRRLPRWLASVSSKLNIDYENNKQKLRNFPPGHDNSSRGSRGGSKLGRYNRSIRLPWGKMVKMGGGTRGAAQVSIDWLPTWRIRNKNVFVFRVGGANQRVLIYPKDLPGTTRS